MVIGPTANDLAHPGTSSIENFDQNIAAADLGLANSELAELAA